MAERPNKIPGYGTFILFLLLEGLCFSLIVRHNQTQKQIYLSTTNAYMGWALNAYNSTIDYLSLGKEIDKLKDENARLRELLPESQYSFTTLPDTALKKLHLDTLQYEFLPAKIVTKTLLGDYNTLTLNIGKDQGIIPPMGVISSEGLVGILTTATKRFSKVILLQNRQTRISASIKNVGNFGSLVWRGSDPIIIDLEAIPLHAEVNDLDTIETSGYSNLFPKGIPIGKIKNHDNTKGNNYKIEVELFNNIYSLKHAYVVKNLLLDELNELEEDE